RHRRGAFWQDDPAERSLSDRWMDWSQTTLQPDFLVGVFWGFYRTPEARRDLPAVKRRIALCARHFTLLDRHLANRSFMLGEALMLADIPIATNLFRYFNLDIDRPSLPHVSAWYERMKDRPAYREHVMVPFEELYGRLEH